MLTIFKNSTNISLAMDQYTDNYSFGTFLDSDYLYVGYKKPIRALYCHLTTVNTNSGTLEVDYYNGSAFTSVADLVDKTVGFTKNNYIEWSVNQTNEAATTVNTTELFWYRISISSTSSALTFRAINLLFSCDEQLKEEASYLLSSDYYQTNETSWVTFHQSARNEIIQRLRNEGHRVYNSSTGHKDLTIFDLLDYKQLQEASKYLVLSKIFFFLSDSTEDKYYQKYSDFKTMYNEAFKTFFISIDVNDDGKQNEAERDNFKSGTIIRV